MSQIDGSTSIPFTTTSSVVTTQTSTPVTTATFDKPRSILITEKFMGLNQVLAKLHHSILPRCGRVFVSCPNLVCFPRNTVDGIRKARELGEKWSDAFYNHRWNDDFKLAGLWTRFFFDIENRVIKVTVEPKRIISATTFHTSTNTSTDTSTNTSIRDVLNDGFVETEVGVEVDFDSCSTVTESNIESNVESDTESNAEYVNSYSTDNYVDDSSYIPTRFPMVPSWTMTPYGWMITQRPWVPYGWGFGNSQISHL